MLSKIPSPFAVSASGSSVSSGTLVFSNANSVSFGMNGNTVTASFSASGAGGAFTGGISGGNTSGNTGTVSNAFILAGGNNITVSGSTNASGMTATISAPNQTVQTQNCVDWSLAGNTSGTLALISSGTGILSGGQNITLSQNGQTVLISGASIPAQSVQTQNCVDATLAGNTAGALALMSSGTVTWAGGNNITLSQNGNAVTISAASIPSQTNQTVGEYLLGNSTLTSSGTMDARSQSFAGMGIISVGFSSNSGVLISASQSVQTQNCVDLSVGGNSTSAGAGFMLISSGTAFLAGGNNITLSQNGQSITISGANTVAQTNQTLGIYGSSNTTGASSSSTVDARSVTIVGQGGVSVGMSSGSVLISGQQTVAQTNQTEGRYAVGNTTGQSSSSTFDARTMSVGGAGIISVGYSSNSGLLISASQSVQTQNLHNVTLSGNTTGTLAAISSGTMTLAGGANITLSQNGNAVTISGAAGAGMSAGMSNTGQTSGTSGTVTGQLVLVGTNGIGLSQSVNAGSATISVQQAPYASIWSPYPFANFGYLQHGNGTFIINTCPVLWPVTATQAMMQLFMSLSSSSNSSHAGSLSMGAGFYTLGTGASSASLMSATTGSTNWQWTVTGNTSYASVQGIRQAPITMNINATPGLYWFGFWSQTSSANANWYTASVLINSQAQNQTNMAPQILGGASNASVQIAPGVGVLSVSTNALPLAIAISDISNAAQGNRIPWFLACNQTF